MKNKTNSILLAIASCLLWSTAFAGIKIGLEYSSPLAFAGTRFFISGLLILPFTCKPVKYIRTVKDNYGILLLLALTQTFLNYALFYSGMDLVPGAVGAVIIGVQPLIIAVIASLMIRNEPFTKKRTATLIAGIAGVVFVSMGRQSLDLGQELEIIGIFLLLGVNFTSGFSNIIVSKYGKKINPLVLSSFSLLVGGLALFLISIPMEGYNSFRQPLEYWASLGWLSFMSAAAFSLWYTALHIPGVKVSDLNLWKFIIPVLGAILSWVVLPGEQPDWITITGMIIISTSLFFFFKRKPRENRISNK